MTKAELIAHGYTPDEADKTLADLALVPQDDNDTAELKFNRKFN